MKERLRDALWDVRDAAQGLWIRRDVAASSASGCSIRVSLSWTRLTAGAALIPIPDALIRAPPCRMSLCVPAAGCSFGDVSYLQPELDPSILIATAKLPDDLTIGEFGALTMSVQGLVDFAWWATDYPEGRAKYRNWIPHRGFGDNPLDSRLLKVQYGSDFLVGIAIAVPVAGVLTSMALGVERIGRAAQSFAAAKRDRAVADAIGRDPRPAAEARNIDAEAELKLADAALKRAEAARTLAGSRQTDLPTELMARAFEGLTVETEHRREDIDQRRQFLRSGPGRRDSENVVAEALKEAGLPEAAQVYLDEGDRETGGALPPMELLASYGVRIEVHGTNRR